MPSVPNFLPSKNGLRFVNSWPKEPAIQVSVPGVGTVGIGDASNGLCGGMSFIVRDVFQAGLPPLQDDRPPQGSPLFDYIVQRLVDSFNLPDGVLKYYKWMNIDDGNTDLWMVTNYGVAWRTVKEEFPKVKRDIDAGHPSPLGLVTVKSTDPKDLGRNHQVLAYAYNYNGDVLTIHLYDPNTDPAQGDGVHLRLNVSHPEAPTPIQHNVGIGDPVRGFFRVDYTPKDPSALEPQ